MNKKYEKKFINKKKFLKFEIIVFYYIYLFFNIITFPFFL